MSEQDWYSASLRFYSVTSADGWIAGEDSVFLVRAVSFEEAMEKFLAIGRRIERTYKNGYDQDVRVRFIEILTIDRIVRDLDGAEIFCTPLLDKVENFSFDTPVDPTQSDPEQTGV